MAVNYSKLLHILIDKNITTAQLAEKAGVSANIISRIKKNEYVSLETIELICKALKCSPNDILNFIEEDKQWESYHYFQESVDLR